MADFGDAVRQLMERKGVTGVQLAQDIGITATSVSRLLNGISKPRQLTLTRIMQRLCATPQEEQLILSAFAGTKESAPDEPRAPFRPTPQDEVERVTRYMEIKSMAVAFDMDVEAILVRSGRKFTRYFRNDPFVTDFLIELDQRRPGRITSRPAANGRAENRDTCRSDRCPESPEDGPRFDHRRPQPTASTSSQAPRLMQPLALDGHHTAHARRLGRVRRLAAPSAYADLLRRHRSGYRLAHLLSSRDFARADKIISF